MRKTLETRLARLEERHGMARWALEMETRELARRLALVLTTADEGDDAGERAAARRTVEMLR